MGLYGKKSTSKVPKVWGGVGPNLEGNQVEAEFLNGLAPLPLPHIIRTT